MSSKNSGKKFVKKQTHAKKSRSSTKSMSSTGSMGNMPADNRITVASFRFLSAQGAANVASTVSVTRFGMGLANFGTRAVDFADCFSEWRMVGLTAVQVPTTTVYTTATQSVSNLGTYLQGIAYTPLNTSEYTVPTVLSTIIDFPHYAFDNDINVVRLSLSRKALLGTLQNRWLRCNGTGTSDLQESQQGSFIQFSITGPQAAPPATSNLARMVIDITCEFRGPVDTVLVPLKKYKSLLATQANIVEVDSEDDEKKSVFSVSSEEKSKPAPPDYVHVRGPGLDHPSYLPQPLSGVVGRRRF